MTIHLGNVDARLENADWIKSTADLAASGVDVSAFIAKNPNLPISKRTQSKKSWDESVHPRAENGEFGSGDLDRMQTALTASEMVNRSWEKHEQDKTSKPRGTLWKEGQRGADNTDPPDQTAVDYLRSRSSAFESGGGKVLIATPEQCAQARAVAVEMLDAHVATTGEDETGITYMRNATGQGAISTVFLGQDAAGNAVAACDTSFNLDHSDLRVGYLGSTGDLPGAGSALMSSIIDFCHDNNCSLSSIATRDSTAFHLDIGRRLNFGGRSYWTKDDIGYLYTGLHSGAKAVTWDEADHPRQPNGEFGEGDSPEAALDRRIAWQDAQKIPTTEHPGNALRPSYDAMLEHKADMVMGGGGWQAMSATAGGSTTLVTSDDINHYLREGDSYEANEEDTKDEIKALDAMIDTHVLPSDTTLYRGVSGDVMDASKIQAGDVITDKGYSAFTPDQEAAIKTFSHEHDQRRGLPD